MRVLFLNQFFYPDTAATSQILTDVVKAIRGQDQVRVVCGSASYAKRTGEGTDLPGVEVRRIRTPRFAHGPLSRVVSYGAYFFGVVADAVLRRPPDVVVSMTTPPLLSIAGWIAQLRGARHFIWEMDLYPDIAVDLDALKGNSPLTALIGAVADFVRRRADGVIALGPCMAQRLLRRGVPPDRIHICHNWADGDVIEPRPFVMDGRLKVLYSGNFGLAHDFDTLSAALHSLGADKRFEFQFAGGGPRRQSLEAECIEASLTSCRFAESRPLDQLADVFGECDIGLVLQKQQTSGSIVPSKTYGIMAAGRPVLFVGPRDATTAQIIASYEVGWQVDNGDSQSLIRLLTWLHAHPHEVEARGALARATFERHFNSRIGIRRVMDVIGVGTTAAGHRSPYRIPADVAS